MLHNFPIIPFLATKSPDKAKAFYTEKLGLFLVEDTAFALVSPPEAALTYGK